MRNTCRIKKIYVSFCATHESHLMHWLRIVRRTMALLGEKERTWSSIHAGWCPWLLTISWITHQSSQCFVCDNLGHVKNMSVVKWKISVASPIIPIWPPTYRWAEGPGNDLLCRHHVTIRPTCPSESGRREKIGRTVALSVRPANMKSQRERVKRV